ncbi:hypothetical protein [Terriglobus aquaticus]|uniref:Uncharacterized protein n=1 Tax=Terriglobus aquaticus TaxID=940139 RepID=A0ABW9KLL6_9BACT|nr:hypothetical protein [Terriglobus aquaticus]
MAAGTALVIPFPKEIPYQGTMLVGALLVAALIAEGNSPVLCLTVLGWMLVTNFGFNIVGGFRNPAGAYILFVTLFTGLLGVFVKALTNEPLVANVPNADQTLLVYMLGTCATTFAALLSLRFRPKKPFLAGRLTQGNTNNVVIGCLVVGIGLPYALYLLAPGLASIARQLNITLPLAILIGVFQRVKATGGRSSFSWPVLIAWAFSTWVGLLSYSKEAMFAPSLAWVVASAAARLRLSILQVITLVPLGAFAVLILVPYSQYGRNFRDETAANPQVAYNLLRHPLALRDKVNRDAAERIDLYHWYNQPRGIFDRLTLVPIDSALIALTDLQGPIGLQNTFNYFENIIPHFILPDKPEIRAGNDYAHEIGMLAPSDHTTGISFSPFGDAYHQAGWLGILLVMPAIQFLMFVAMNYVLGSTEEAPWALFFVMAFAHIAAEGMLSFPVYIISFGMEAVVATAFAMIYLTPMIGSLLLGPGRNAIPERSFAQPARTRFAAEARG